MQSVTSLRMSSLDSNRRSRLNLSRSKTSSSTLPPVPMYSQNNNSDESVHSADYKLIRVDTSTSLNSYMSVQSQYKVQLKLSKSEIDLLRFTWNKMLLDDPIEQDSNIPGAFPLAPTEKSTRISSRSSSSTVASSLFCRQFYSNLILMDSTLEKLFPSIRHQAVSFAGVMSLAISQLENLGNLDDYLMNLGKRHARVLCIEPPNFELMGEALIQTFHERFGVRFTQELEVLWIKLYLYLANSILQFGIDPVIKLDYENDSNYGYSYDKSFEKRSSVQASQTSTIATSIMDEASIATATTSIAQIPRKESKKLATMKKRKRDCTIM